MNSNPFLKYYFLVGALLISTCITCLFIFKISSLAELIIFIMTVISVLIAMLAYHISIKTYVSIDAVNAISRMEGNVMENEGYRTNIAAQIRRFSNPEKEAVRKALLDHIKNLFNNHQNLSGARLADNIQEVIDVIVLLPFIINSKDKKYSEDSIKEIDELIYSINSKIDTYEKISDGSCILMKESIKLINAVFAYQKIKSQKTSSNCTLMDVRGTMLRNAVSKTVYYNYMGLLYLTKATESILQYLANKTHHTNIYSIEILRSIKDNTKDDLPELTTSHLETALEYFKTASNIIEEDVMWNSFISFNIGRAEFLLNLISRGKKGINWISTMNSAINYRKRLNLILSDVLNDTQNRSYFQRAFIGEEHKARLMKMIFEIVSNQDITNIHGQKLYSKSNYGNILSSKYIKELPEDEFNLYSGHIIDIQKQTQSTNRILKYS